MTRRPTRRSLTRDLSGIHGSDDVTLVGGLASFADKNVGLDKPVSVSGLSLAGADAGNYVLSSTSVVTQADITPFSLTISASADDKVYDGTTDAVAHLSDDHIFGDDLTTSHTSATFDTAAVGLDKPVAISGIALAGADALNYSAATTASATAAITNRRGTARASPSTAGRSVYLHHGLAPASYGALPDTASVQLRITQGDPP